jgi:hypothetical protein
MTTNQTYVILVLTSDCNQLEFSNVNPGLVQNENGAPNDFMFVIEHHDILLFSFATFPGKLVKSVRNFFGK